MRSWRCLSVLTSFAIVFAAIVALPATTAAASSSAHYVIFATNEVPILNIFETGTLVLDVQGTPSSFTFTWTFQGMTDGVPAFASGTGSGSGDLDNLTINLDTISAWNVPGFPQPEVGKTAFLTRAPNGGLGFFFSLYFLTLNDFPNFPHPIVAGVPVFVFPSFAGPVTSGNHVLFESSFGSGSTNFRNLPGQQTQVGSRSVFPAAVGF